MVSSAREAIDLNKKAGNKREDQLIDRDRPISLFFVIDEVGVYVHSPFTKKVLTNDKHRNSFNTEHIPADRLCPRMTKRGETIGNLPDRIISAEPKQLRRVLCDDYQAKERHRDLLNIQRTFFSAFFCSLLSRPSFSLPNPNEI